MDYPLEKYKFYFAGNKTVAVSSYAGKQVRGVATCAPSDKYDIEKGKRLAAARCALKIAEKRVAHADRRVEEARDKQLDANAYMEKMVEYRINALMSLDKAEEAIDSALDEI